MNKLFDVFLVVLVLIALGAFMSGVVWLGNHQQQKMRMENTADCALGYGKENRSAEFINNLMATDIWGNHMNINYEVTKEFIKVTVTSMGADEKPNTEDDWKLEKFDYNKSYLLGKFTGERAKEIASGVVDGILEKDKFKDNEQAD